MPQDRVYTLKDFHFNLPEELIAQYPSPDREGSRLLVLNRKSGENDHALFRDIGKYLREGDVLVLNDAKVIPARIYFTRETGGMVEIVLAQQLSDRRWNAICNRTKRLKKNEVLSSVADRSLQIKITGRKDDFIEIETNTELTPGLLEKTGEMPLPPYIARKATDLDRERYQTVYADSGSAAASPTAGLHFSRGLMDKLLHNGIVFVRVTLHVSWGTFQPVRENDLSKHRMHTERFSLKGEAAETINTAREKGGRIIAVGTTSLRVLEATLRNGRNVSGDGETDLFIYPPREIKSIDAMITNFHTPCSTLLMLVSSFAGHEKIMMAYAGAIEDRYRFFSYGDAMLIL